MTRLLILLLLMAGGLSGCLDHKIPSITPGLPVTRLRVKAIVFTNMDVLNEKYISFGYDGQGRLSSVTSYWLPDSSIADVVRGSYLYDDKNRLKQFRQVNKAGGSDVYDYSYNENDQVSRISHSGGLIWNYGYTETNQLATASLSYSHPRFSIRGDLKFAFTGNNLTQLFGGTRIRYQGMPEGTSDSFPGVSGAIYTHDDKLNPFYGVFVIPSPVAGFTNVLSSPGTPRALFGGIDNVLTLSQNNVLTETPDNEYLGNITYEYQYNASNLPTMRIKTTRVWVPFQTTGVETLRFEYESY